MGVVRSRWLLLGLGVVALTVPGMTASPLLIVDGTNLAHRAWYAHKDADAMAAQVAAWLLSAANRVGASGMLCAFDAPDGTASRKAMFPDYKAGRAEREPELKDAVADAPRLIAARGIPTLVPQGAEADDVLATYARAGERVVLVSGDNDAKALLEFAGTEVLVPTSTPAGVAGWKLVTADRLAEMTGVEAVNWRLYAAAKGDTSDAIPGLPGVGPKKAAALAAAFGTVHGLQAALEAGEREALAGAVGKSLADKLLADVAESVRMLRLSAAVMWPITVANLPDRARLEELMPRPEFKHEAVRSRPVVRPAASMAAAGSERQSSLRDRSPF